MAEKCTQLETQVSTWTDTDRSLDEIDGWLGGTLDKLDDFSMARTKDPNVIKSNLEMYKV